MAARKPPFEADRQLNADLLVSISSSKSAPILVRSDQSTLGLPDRPWASLNRQSVEETLTSDLVTASLNRMTPYLWLVSTPRSSHVLPLHRQAVRGRKIVPCETPALHLVWYSNGIFVKPLPGYLLSHGFWSYCLHEGIFQCPGQIGVGLHDAALGFLRTYVYLIRYPIDFKIAQEHHLVPENSKFEDFIAFISAFSSIRDADVAPRYSYGELRLSRLNRYTPFLLFPKLFYHNMAPQWNMFLGEILAPMLSVFAVLSIVLNAMQVGLGAQASSTQQYSTGAFVAASWLFSVIALAVAGAVILLMLSVFMFLLVHETCFALGVLYRTRGKKVETSKWSSAVVS